VSLGRKDGTAAALPRLRRLSARKLASDEGKIPCVLGMQNVLNGVSMAVGVMEMALYSSYTH